MLSGLHGVVSKGVHADAQRATEAISVDDLSTSSAHSVSLGATSCGGRESGAVASTRKTFEQTVWEDAVNV